MSSILDALKKLEEEKAAKQAQERARQLTGDRRHEPDLLATAGDPSPRAEIRMKPGTLFASIFVAVTLVATASAVLTVSMLSGESVAEVRAEVTAPAPAEPPTTTETSNLQAPDSVTPLPELSTPAPAAQAPAAPTAPPEPTITAVIQEDAGPSASTETAPTPQSQAIRPASVVPAPAPAPEPEPEPSPEPIPRATPAPPPAPEPARAPEPKPEPESAAVYEKETTLAAADPPAPRRPTPPAAPTTPREQPREAAFRAPSLPEKIELRTLTFMRPSDQSKYGLQDLRINMLRDISETRPYGTAILNLDKVFIGDEIPNSKVRLIAIDEKLGIGVEVLETGQRFFVQR